MKLVFATNNLHKIQEVKHLLKKSFHLLSLKQVNCNEELPETGYTLEQNAKQKARYVFKKYHTNCFADDTGLEIEALNGMPGIFSARYAGEEKNAKKNIEKLLNEMQNMTNRNACFKTIISLIINNKEYCFEGKIEGRILADLRGKQGFGYDPVFMPSGHNKSLAEMSLEEKNKISHRAIAIKKLVAFLIELKNSG